MGFVMSTYGIAKICNSAIVSGATDLRCAVIATGGTITDAQIEDAQFVSQIIGVASEAEVTNANYARQTLTSVVVAPDTTLNRVDITAVVPTINNVGAGNTWRRVLYYWQVGADSANPIIGVDTPASTLTPNGGNVTIPPLTLRLNDTSV